MGAMGAIASACDVAPDLPRFSFIATESANVSVIDLSQNTSTTIKRKQRVIFVTFGRCVAGNDPGAGSRRSRPFHAAFAALAWCPVA